MKRPARLDQNLSNWARWSAGAAWLALAAVSSAPVGAMAPRTLPGSDSTHFRLQFEDSTITINDRCPVRGGNLNWYLRPMYVNGRAVGFC